jgi:hypothetical protein
MLLKFAGGTTVVQTVCLNSSFVNCRLNKFKCTA